MREVLWPVEDVGQLLASAASAVTAALEYHCNRMGRQPTNLSTLFVHYNARRASGHHGANHGTTMEATLKAVVDHGSCSEESWPLDPSKFALQPPPALYEQARAFAGVTYSNPADPLEALALRYPVPAVVRVPHVALKEAGRSGALPPVTTDDAHRNGMEHGLLLVGYDKNRRTFLARNCWGTQWGDGGHCTIGFDTMAAIAPAGSPRLWFISSPKSATADAGTSGVSRPEAVGTGQVSDLAARMRDEIRGGLQRDIEDATRRIRESLRGPGGGNS
ncbi:MAG: hypothetical protein IT183_05745 [Acidobacteria bacterium]|nr:hypothetical protein [Acidobacteriota bacterium]